jgi:exosortase/archaeosortase family protein
LRGKVAGTGRATPRASRKLSRGRLFAALFLIASLNAFSALAAASVASDGWALAAANLFGISAVIWAALAAGLKILAADSLAEPVRRGDLGIAAVVAIAALLPAATASMLALTLLAGHAIYTGPRGSILRRAGLIFLAMSGALLWGRLTLAVFSRPLLDLDALFVSQLIGAEQQGNMLISGSTRLIVAPGCSSMQGLSLALLFCVTFSQLFEIRFDRRAASWFAAALAATVAINVLRIGAMLRFPDHLSAIHHGWGYQLSMWATLAAVAAICVFGARRELFAHA